jgi:hypothetical protein
MRRLLTALVALLGLALMVVGIWGAQPIPAATSPRLLGGAFLWIVGIMILIASPAVYCLAPERKARE